MTRWGGEFTWVPGGTCCQLWAKEIARVGKCPACSTPRREYKGTPQSTDAPFEMAPWEPNGEPVVFCPAPGCGLTADDGGRCWVHRGVGGG